MKSGWRIGPCVLFPRRRRLESGGGEVALGSRAFDLLVYLVRHAGEVVGKEELLRTVWSGVVVEEANLRVHVSNLRKALAAMAPEAGGWIVNVPLRGYMFRGPVERIGPQSSVALVS